jgi:toxin-antitoxin system PIN domain toxin
MGGFIDTNLLIYAANQDAADHPRAKAFIESALNSNDAWFMSTGVAYEFLRVATHPKVFPKPLNWRQALEFLEPFIRSENIRFLEAGHQHWQVLRDVLSQLTHPSGNLFFDVRTVTLMRESGLREIFTTDTDFLQFANLTVINPLKGTRETQERKTPEAGSGAFRKNLK